MYSIKIETSQTISYLQGLQGEARSRAFQVIRNTANAVANEARNAVQQARYDLGNLYRSINTRVSPSGDYLEAEVVSTAPHAHWVHEGVRYHRVSFNNPEAKRLVEYALRHHLIQRGSTSSGGVTPGGKKIGRPRLHVDNRYYSALSGQPIRGITVGLPAFPFLTWAFDSYRDAFVVQMSTIYEQNISAMPTLNSRGLMSIDKVITTKSGSTYTRKQWVKPDYHTRKGRKR